MALPTRTILAVAPLLLVSACGPALIGTGIGSTSGGGGGGPPALSASLLDRPRAITNQTTATFEVAVQPAGADVSLWMSFDGQPAQPVGPRFQIAPVAEGSHEVAVLAVASDGREARVEFRWEVDTAAPVTRFTSVPPAFTNAETAEFTFDAEPGSRFFASFDGVAIPGEITSPLVLPGSTGVSLGEGDHEVEVHAVDAAGNREDPPVAVRFVVDRTLPQPVPDPRVFAEGRQELRVTWNAASDDRSGIAGYRLLYDTERPGPFGGTGATQGASPVNVGSPANRSASLTGLQPCRSYFVAVTAVDRAGNESLVALHRQVRTGCGPTGTFGEPVVTDVPGGARFVRVGDFDGDGIPDVAAFGTTTATILLNTPDMVGGTGTFRGEVVVHLPADIEHVEVADLDGDRDTDIVAVHQSYVSVLESEGGGPGLLPTFTRRQFSSAFGRGGTHVIVVDLNNDGVPDLATCGDRTGYISGYRGLGAASFAADQTITPARGDWADALRIAVADLDGDGAADWIVSTLGIWSGPPPGLWRILSTGRPEFVLPVPVDSPILLRDLDGDLHVDVAFRSFGSPDVSILFGDGAGSFPASARLGGVPGLSTFDAADINGDERVDLALAGSGEVGVWMNDGGRSWRRSPGSPRGGTDVRLAGLRVPGLIDLVVAGGSSLAVSSGGGEVLLADGTFSRIPEIETSEHDWLATMDFDLDQDDDLVMFACEPLPSIASLRVDGPDGAGGVALAGSAETSLVRNCYTSFAVGDAGSLALSATAQVPGGLSVVDAVTEILTPDFRGRFIRIDYHKTIVYSSFAAMASGDVDGDARTDFVMLFDRDSDLRARVWDGLTRTFSEYSSASVYAQSWAPMACVARLSPGMREDVAVFGSGWYLWIESSRWVTPTGMQLADLGIVRRAVAADLDEDSEQLDEVIVFSETNGLLVFAPDGSGGLGPPRTLIPGFLADGLAGHLDSDPHVDVAALTSAGDVLILRGDGTGALSVVHRVPTRAPGVHLVQGDIDGDGLADLVVSHGDGVTVLRGGGVPWPPRR